jgi:hypothetical protein
MEIHLFLIIYLIINPKIELLSSKVICKFKYERKLSSEIEQCDNKIIFIKE